MNQDQTLKMSNFGDVVVAFWNWTTWSGTFACLVAFVGLYWILQQPRGPRRLPLLGSTIETMWSLDYHHDWTTKYAKRFKTFNVHVLGLRLIYTVDPAAVEYFLKTNFSNYYKGPIMYEVQNDLLGGGIFNTDGERWRQQRKIVSVEFSPRILREISTEAFRKYAIRLVNILIDEARNKGVVDIQDLLMRMSLDSIGELGWGVEINSLSPSLPVIPIAAAFDRSNSISLTRHFDYTWKLKRMLNIGSEAKLKQDIKLLDDFTYGVIEKRRRELNGSVGEKMTRRDVLSRFIDMGKDHPDIYNDKMLRDVVLNFLLAGRDSTATTLSWFLYMVFQHPEVQSKILEEVYTVLRNANTDFSCTSLSVEQLAQMLTYELLGKMQYLHSALSETVRLYPAVPEDSKIAIKDDILPDGTRVRAGDALVYLPYAMGRMEELWGKDALEFKPERWMEEGVFVPESPFKFTAFQAGPRSCLGKDSAFLQMKITATLLMHFFQMKLEGDRKSVRYALALTLFLRSGLPLRVQIRHQPVAKNVAIDSCASNSQ